MSFKIRSHPFINFTFLTSAPRSSEEHIKLHHELFFIPTGSKQAEDSLFALVNSDKTEVYFDVDGMQLHHFFPDVFDTVFFTIPFGKGGYQMGLSEHEFLIKYFLDAANQIIRSDGEVRIALELKQLVEWNVEYHADKYGLELVKCGNSRHHREGAKHGNMCHYFKVHVFLAFFCSVYSNIY
jgi:hypothetical protein